MRSQLLAFFRAALFFFAPLAGLQLPLLNGSFPGTGSYPSQHLFLLEAFFLVAMIVEKQASNAGMLHGGNPFEPLKIGYPWREF